MSPTPRGAVAALGVALLVAAALASALPGALPSKGRPPSASVAAAQARDMEIVAQIGAAVRDLAVDGDRIYVVVGSRIAAIDAGDPEHPRLTAWSGPLPRLPADLDAENGYVHVALERTGYQVLDATDPTQLRRLGYLEGRLYWPRSIAVSGDRAVVIGSGASEGSDTLTVYDLATPAAPMYRGETGLTSTWYHHRGLEILGSTAWAADTRTIRVFDISNPGRPTAVRRLDWPGWQLGDLAIDRAMAFVAGGPIPTPPSDTSSATEAGAETAGGAGPALASAAPDGPADPAVSAPILRLLDATTPGSPIELAAVETARDEMGEAAAAAERHAFVLSQYPWILRGFDVADPAAVRPVGDMALAAADGDLRRLGGEAELQPLGSSGGHLALLTNQSVRIIDVTDPSLPRLAGAIDMPGWGIRGVAALGGHVYVADDKFGLRIVEATDPSTPRQVGAVPMSPGRLAGVVVTERQGSGGGVRRFAFAVAFGYGLFSFDVTEPAAARLLGSVDTAGTSRDVAVAGDLAFVADGDRGLQIVDVSDPASPRLRGSLVVPSSELPAPHAFYVAVEGDLAFVAYKHDKLVQVVDVSDPDRPRELGRTPERIGNVEPADIAVADGRLYVVGSSSGSRAGLEVYDVAVADDPRQTGFLAAESGLYGVALAGDVAYTGPYLVRGKPTLLEVDISDPVRPRALRSVELPGYYHHLAVDGGLVFAAEDGNGQFSESGLTIVRTGRSDEATATPDGTSPAPSATPSPTATGATPGVSASPTATAATPVLTPTEPAPPEPPRLLFFPLAHRSGGAALEGLEADEYAVLRAAIEHLYGDSGHAMFVIVDHTTAPLGGVDCGRLGSNMPGLTRSLCEAFELRSEDVLGLVDAFGLASAVVLIGREELDEIFAVGGWDEFYRRYPGSNGAMMLSRAGFDLARGQALVYVGRQSHYLAGAGWAVLLERRGQDWVVTGKEMLWIS